MCKEGTIVWKEMDKKGIRPLDCFILMLKNFDLTVQQFILIVLCELERRAFIDTMEKFDLSDEAISECQKCFRHMMKIDREQPRGIITFAPEIPQEIQNLINQIYVDYNIRGNLNVIIEPDNEDPIYFANVQKGQLLGERILVINSGLLSSDTSCEEKFGALLHLLVGCRQFLNAEKLIYLRNLIGNWGAFYNTYGFLSILFADQFPASFSIENARCIELMLNDCDVKNGKAEYLERFNQEQDEVRLITWDDIPYPILIPTRKLRLKCVKTVRKLLEAEERINNSNDPEIINYLRGLEREKYERRYSYLS